MGCSALLKDLSAEVASSLSFAVDGSAAVTDGQSLLAFFRYGCLAGPSNSRLYIGSVALFPAAYSCFVVVCIFGNLLSPESPDSPPRVFLELERNLGGLERSLGPLEHSLGSANPLMDRTADFGRCGAEQHATLQNCNP